MIMNQILIQISFIPFMHFSFASFEVLKIAGIKEVVHRYFLLQSVVLKHSFASAVNCTGI